MGVGCNSENAPIEDTTIVMGEDGQMHEVDKDGVLGQEINGVVQQIAGEIDQAGQAYQYTGYQPASVQPVAAAAPIETLPGQFAGAPIEATIHKAEAQAVNAVTAANQGSSWYATPQEALAHANAQGAVGVSPALGAVGAPDAIPIQDGVISGGYTAAQEPVLMGAQDQAALGAFAGSQAAPATAAPGGFQVVDANDEAAVKALRQQVEAFNHQQEELAHQKALASLPPVGGPQAIDVGIAQPQAIEYAGASLQPQPIEYANAGPQPHPVAEIAYAGFQPQGVEYANPVTQPQEIGYAGVQPVGAFNSEVRQPEAIFNQGVHPQSAGYNTQQIEYQPQLIDPAQASYGGVKPLQPDQPAYGNRPLSPLQPAYDQPPQQPAYDQPAYGGAQPINPEQPSYGGAQPIHPEQPIYGGAKPINPEIPVYGCAQPVNPEQPAYGGVQPINPEQPAYGGVQPVNPEQPIYGGAQPVNPEQPAYGGSQPVSPEQPVYGGQPINPEQPAYGGQPAYGQPSEPVQLRSQAMQPQGTLRDEQPGKGFEDHYDDYSDNEAADQDDEQKPKKKKRWGIF